MPNTIRAARLDLLAVSFLALFLELAFIRFVNSTVQVVAYFNNFMLLSAFLGLGLGSTLVRNGGRDLLVLLPGALAGLTGLLVLLDRASVIGITQDLVYFMASGPGNPLPALPVMFVVFVANCAFFTCIGHRLGATLVQFPDRLESYSYDLLGSLAGVAGLTAVSFFRAPPWAWLAVGSVVTLWLLRRQSPRALATQMAFCALAIFLSTLPASGRWSPYYKVNFVPYETTGEPIGYAVVVDKLRIQDAFSFGPALAESSHAGWIPYYQMPFRFRKPERVLVLGGGSGNDAAMALRFDARQVDVVEIDPLLVEAGSTLHPERPYADPRVRVINDDARAFLRRSRDSYDLIVMNALDSHHQLPGLSTLRLESFIYTTEAFRDLRRRLAPDGIVSVHLSSTREWMGQRLYRSLSDAFGSAPHLFMTPKSPFASIAFMYGPAEILDAPPPGVAPLSPGSRAEIATETRPATDDWPHLYLRSNDLPTVYIEMLVMIVAFAALVLYRSVRRLGEPRHLQLFLLGAGFMLLETRSITQTALLFGATWLVNSLVIGAILLVILLGNQLVRRGLKSSLRVAAGALLLSLAAAWLVSPSITLALPFAARVIVASAWIALPIFFASLVFSHVFRDVHDTASAFGANLLGVVLGGALEYASMVFGLNALYVIAFGIYAIAIAVGGVERRAVTA